MCLESSGKPDAGKLARPVWGWGRGEIPRPTPPTSRSSEPLEISHEIQLSCYAYLLRHNSSVHEAGLEIRSLVKTKIPKVELHRYAVRNEKHFGRLFAVVRAYIDDLDSGRFLFRPGLGCAMCEFRKTCFAMG